MVQDNLVEDDELISFQAVPSNSLDVFTDNNNSLALTIWDDDGKNR